ncbi:hypothetical protein AB0F81_50330 [Actinoplanes sp. NPDC024001]|uniref:hypothetical protein n=1 Tax=Actinoplanes sp. NPDC024001 TaxID=3154598 RepID=UPI0033FF96BF
MCLLTFLPPGVQPDPHALHNGSLLNDDGHGFAIATGDSLLVRHSMNGEQLIDEFTAARRTHADGPALFHSRWGTGGTVDVGNCHPLRVGGDARTVLAHNGVLPIDVGANEPRSDTRIAAEDLIPAMGPLRLRRTRLRLRRWMGDHNKIAILTVDRRYRRNAYLLNEQAGIWDGGIWYSNTGYRDLFAPRTLLGRLAADPATCWWCSEPLDDDRHDCLYCGACQDCRATDGWCLCRRALRQAG